MILDSAVPFTSKQNKLPPAFLERIRAQYEREHVERILAGMSSARVTAFRINHLRSSGSHPFEELSEQGLSIMPSTFSQDAAWISPNDREKLLSSSAYVEKRIYVQNLASMMPVIALAPEPGERILDLAAAPGSKTLQIASEIGTDGEIAAVEFVRKRFFRMKANLAAYGADFVRTYLRDGSTVWRSRPEYFDRVLLDAPCASEGRFLIDTPETFRFWSPRKTSEMVRKQRKLLFSAIQAVRPGGIVIYSTCSLSAEENEGVVSKILTRFGDALETEPLSLDVNRNVNRNVDEMVDPLSVVRKKPVHPGVANARRILPSAYMEGFFVCRIRKLSSTID